MRGNLSDFALIDFLKTIWVSKLYKQYRLKLGITISRFNPLIGAINLLNTLQFLVGLIFLDSSSLSQKEPKSKKAQISVCNC